MNYKQLNNDQAMQLINILAERFNLTESEVNEYANLTTDKHVAQIADLLHTMICVQDHEGKEDCTAECQWWVEEELPNRWVGKEHRLWLEEATKLVSALSVPVDRALNMVQSAITVLGDNMKYAQDNPRTHNIITMFYTYVYPTAIEFEPSLHSRVVAARLLLPDVPPARMLTDAQSEGESES